MDRRQFIKSVVTAAAGTAVSLKLTGVAHAIDKISSRNANNPDVVAVRNGEPDKMFRTGIAAFGGMKAFVKPGQKVIIKPNASFDSPPEYSANTNPVLMGEIVRQCIAAGASEVGVFDHTLNDWRSTYRNSGIEAAVVGAGGKMLAANEEGSYRKMDSPRAKRLKETAVYKPLLEADVLINVPVLKNHGGAKMSCAIKNLMGCVWDRRIMHSNDLNQSIAEMLLYMKPALNVVDAYRIMVSNGPRGTGPADVNLVKYQVISPNIVAADAVATQILGYKLGEVPYIGIAEKLGFGQSNLKRLKISRMEA